MEKLKSRRGFTLLELMIVVGIVIITTSAVLVLQGSFLTNTYLDSKTNEVAQTLKLAQMRSITQFNSKQWGVYFDEDLSGNNDKFVLFAGTSYATRDASFDIVTDLPDSLALSNINLNGGGKEVIFTKVTGVTVNNGTVTLSDKNDISHTNIVTINAKGLIALNETAGGGGGGSTLDTTAPSAIANLVLSNIAEATIDASWTAPGDDANTGTATSYDLRCSASTINEGNWASAIQIVNEPAPLVAGATQSMTVFGLNPGTKYYFAMKTSDEVPNISALSNVPSATTLSLAQSIYLVVNTGSVSLSSGNKYVDGITIQNSGANSIIIDKMTVSWTGGASGNQIRQVNISGSSKWSGNSNSGTLLDITNFTLTTGAGTYPVQLRFKKSMLGANVSLTFTMSDGSIKTVSNIQF